jgi:hypothetical protein
MCAASHPVAVKNGGSQSHLGKQSAGRSRTPKRSGEGIQKSCCQKKQA